MFLNLLRVAEPYLKAFSYRFISPWKGNHIMYKDLGRAIVPWGFVSQREVLVKVTPARSDGRVEKRAELLNLNMQEFLWGTEVAYRSVARLFAACPFDDGARTTSSEGAADRTECMGESKTAEVATAPTASTSGDNMRSERGRSNGSSRGKGFDERDALRGREGAEAGEEGLVSYTDFLELDVASPQMSMFLNDVLESYRRQRLIPRLSVTSVEAKLCNLGIRLGGISKNTNFLGSMSTEEAKYHLTMGMLGPESVLINELEGNAPQKVIADVRLTCDEEFVLEDERGNVVHRNEGETPRVHYFTLQSNIGEEGEFEWQVTNINDVIKPNLAYYFSRFGH